MSAIQDHVDEDDLTKREVIDSMGRKQENSFINESGLFSLILSSKLPSAKRFKHWAISSTACIKNKNPMNLRLILLIPLNFSTS